jgi:hypothetical protein
MRQWVDGATLYVLGYHAEIDAHNMLLAEFVSKYLSIHLRPFC